MDDDIDAQGKLVGRGDEEAFQRLLEHHAERLHARTARRIPASLRRRIALSFGASLRAGPQERERSTWCTQPVTDADGRP